MLHGSGQAGKPPARLLAHMGHTTPPPSSFILQASSFTSENLHLPHLLMGQQTDEL